MITTDVLAKLFVPWQATELRPVAFEIGEVASGRKPVAMYTLDPASIGDPWWRELMDAAMVSGVQVHLRPCKTSNESPIRDHLMVFVCTASEMWRIPALAEISEILEQFQWSDAAEAIRSRLLGYANAQIIEWLRGIHRERIRWRGTLLYVAMSVSQLKATAQLGLRALDPKQLDQDLCFRFGGAASVRGDAEAVIPSEVTLTRMAVTRECAKMLFPQECQPGTVQSQTLTDMDAVLINRALESGIQIFAEGQWYEAGERLGIGVRSLSDLGL